MVDRTPHKLHNSITLIIDMEYSKTPQLIKNLDFMNLLG